MTERLIKLIDMTQVRNLTDTEPICYNDNCEYFGAFEECYTHLHAYCSEFNIFYNKLLKGGEDGI